MTAADHAALEPRAVRPVDVPDVREFLAWSDLTLAGLDDPAVRLWAVRDGSGAVVGTTGFERSADGRHALLRSVAVDPALRGSGAGTRLAAVLADTTQVTLFRASGQLEREVAWSRRLGGGHVRDDA